MTFRTWLDSWKSISQNRRTQRGQPRPRRKPEGCKLSLLTLEDRTTPTFATPVPYDVGVSPYAVVAADFNNDTFLDLATANNSDSTVSVLLGNVGGTFQPAQNSFTGTSPLSVAVGDFNADGKLDLATANANDVSVLLGNGNGTFQAPTNIALGSSPASVAVGDFNGDGKLDLGVTSNVYIPGYQGPGYWDYYGNYYPGNWYPGYHEGRANVLVGNGDGSFSTPNTTNLGSGYHTSAAAANFNGDTSVNGHAIQDFATVNYDNGTVSVLLGTATGLGAPRSYTTGWYPRAVTAGDFTGDGKLDLATAGQTVDILPGNGDGTFQAVPRVYVDPAALAAADFNGDGKLDLATADPGSGIVSVLLGRGDGTLTLPIEFAAGSSPSALVVGDFNGDGRPDVAAANAGSGNVSVLLNDGAWPALNAPSLSINDVMVTEGNAGTTSATFTVTLSAAHDRDVTVSWATADGYYWNSGTAGVDYASAAGTLTFRPGEALTQTIPIEVNGDRVAEAIESFFVKLSAPGYAFIVDGLGVGSIVDDEPTVSFATNLSALEGNTGTTPFTFTVTLSAAYDAPVTVDFATADFTPDEEYWYGPGATAGVDYTATSGTVTFAAGDTSKTITVLVTGERLVESNESFYVNLSNPTSATLGTSQASATIEDDDRISFLVSGFPSSATAGEAHPITVTALDYFGNVVTDYTGAVTFTSSDPQAVLPGSYTFTTGVGGDNGTHIFTVTLKTAGTQSLTVTDTTTPDFTGTQGGIVVNPAAASTFVVTGFPSSLTAGVAGAFTVTAFDAYGNTATGYRGTVHFTSSDGSATLPANYIFAAVDNGVATLGATLRAVGTQSITVTDTVSPTITGSQAGIRVIPLASVTGPSYAVLNQTLTFTLGASGSPAGTVFSYAIDWNGDGSVDQTVSGPSGATVNHTYAASGTYSIGVTATVRIGTQDYTSNVAYQYATVFAVSVTIQTDPGDATKKALVVEGSANAETLVLSPGTGNGVALSINGTSVGTFAAPGGVAFGHLLVYGYGGNDTLRLTGGLTVPAFLFGGDGNDTLDAVGSTANNVLVGGAGADALTGGSGRDLLSGGVGVDTLRGGGGDDILIGGYTDYDANLTALLAVMKEWGRTDADYSTRVNHLNGSLSGGLNGSYFLKAATVHDDAAIDSLYGEAGLDWFFVRKSGNKKDKVNDLSTGEVVTAIS